MPYFAFMGIDRPGMEECRSQSREAHRSHLRASHRDCVFLSGGPLVKEAGGPMTGSLLVFEAATREDVEDVVAQDPYTAQDLFARTELHMLDWTVGAPTTSRLQQSSADTPAP